ncbi:LHFPL tetraspan subfamily member 2a protein isoform X3 [Pleuronectes platessa]|uniref:LHFPL tetraspan subfamily member 2a protein isoform X3 n=1 Tax=Pleuronectes platessa TaxID=8262 RepID=UPI00232A670D|nr:LHFPL tetraspan subfamily member 2a protein isoform X3 [Pleuronectes platessa]
MCHVIVTCRSMLWTLLSIVVAFAELIAFMSPDWLLGFPRSDSGVSGAGVDPGEYRPSLGLYSRCLQVGARGVGVSCGPYAGTFGEVASGFWKAAMLFLAAGTLVLGIVACISIFSLCFQSILKKSIFNICGLLQAIAVLPQNLEGTFVQVLRGEGSEFTSWPRRRAFHYMFPNWGVSLHVSLNNKLPQACC